MIINFCSICGLDISKIQYHDCRVPDYLPRIDVYNRNQWCPNCGKIAHTHPCVGPSLEVYVVHQIQEDNGHCDTHYDSKVWGVFLNKEDALKEENRLRDKKEYYIRTTPVKLKVQ